MPFQFSPKDGPRAFCTKLVQEIHSKNKKNTTCNRIWQAMCGVVISEKADAHVYLNNWHWIDLLIVDYYLNNWHTSREQTFHLRPKWALVPVFFAPGTRETFSPGWRHQPGLKVPAQRLLRSAQWQGTFSPGWRHQPGLKVDLYSRLEPPTGTKSPPTFTPGW